MSGEETDRVKCPSCAESIAAEARICPHCRSAVLVDVVLERPLAEPRLRYQLARQVAALGAPYPALLEAQRRLADPRPVLGSRMSFSDARRCLELLERNGLAGSVQESAPADREPRGVPSLPPLRRWGLLAAGALIVLVAAALLAVRWQRSAHAPVASPAAKPGPNVPEGPRTLSTQEIAARLLPATVAVHCGGSTGAGFFVTEDTVLTNAHVVADGFSGAALRLADGREAVGIVGKKLKAIDLAMIEVVGVRGTPVRLGDAAAVQAGEKVLLVGSPEGLEFTVHEGMVSNVSRTRLGMAYLQLDAKINPGNSGGPVVNMKGEVVGVVTLKLAQAEGIGFALPINYAFSGTQALVEPPANVDAARFESLLAEASAEEEQAVASVEEATRRRALLRIRRKGRPSQYGARDEFELSIGQLSKAQPDATTQRVNVWSEGSLACSIDVELTDWQVVGGATIATFADPAAASWLRRHDLDARLYVGTAYVPRPPCPAAAVAGPYVLELEGGEPGHSRAMVR